jgi:predicted  nucleic acid-binding Zn ribbon protein
MENLNFILENISFEWRLAFLNFLLFVILAIIVIYYRRKTCIELKTNVIYWKQQWEYANNLSKEMQKEIDLHNENIVTISDTYNASINKKGQEKFKRTEKQLQHDAIMQLQNEIIKSNCLKIKNTDSQTGDDIYIVSLTLIK